MNLSILDNSAANVGPWWLEAYNSLTRHVVLFATAVFFQARRPKYNCTFQTDIYTWIFLRYQNDGLLSIHLNDTNISYFALVGTLFIMPIPKQIYLNSNLKLHSFVSHQKMQFWSSVINRVYEISVLWLVRLIAPGETSYKTRPQWRREDRALFFEYEASCWQGCALDALLLCKFYFLRRENYFLCRFLTIPACSTLLSF